MTGEADGDRPLEALAALRRAERDAARGAVEAGAAALAERMEASRTAGAALQALEAVAGGPAGESGPIEGVTPEIAAGLAARGRWRARQHEARRAARERLARALAAEERASEELERLRDGLCAAEEARAAVERLRTDRAAARRRAREQAVEREADDRPSGRTPQRMA